MSRKADGAVCGEAAGDRGGLLKGREAPNGKQGGRKGNGVRTGPRRIR